MESRWAFAAGVDVYANESLSRAFAEALVRSLAAETERLGIDDSKWRLEFLAPHGHVCPHVGFQSHHACLIPSGSNAWCAHELYCVVDWTCNGWCQGDGAPVEGDNAEDPCEQLMNSLDPASLCQFRAYIAVLQGGFGLPKVHREQSTTN